MFFVNVFLCILRLSGWGCVGLLVSFIVLQFGGILVGYFCNRYDISSWFKIRLCISWKTSLCFVIDIRDVVLGSVAREFITNILVFHLPLQCKNVAISHIAIEWGGWQLMPKLLLKGMDLCFRVTTLSDWSSEKNLPVSSPFYPSLYAFVSWRKKHQLANDLSRMVELFLRDHALTSCNHISFITAIKDAFVANLHLSMHNFQLRSVL